MMKYGLTLAATAFLLAGIAVPAQAQNSGFDAYFAEQAHPGFGDVSGAHSYNLSNDIDPEVLQAIAPAAGGGNVDDLETMIEEVLPSFYSEEELEMRPDELPENTGP